MFDRLPADLVVTVLTFLEVEDLVLSVRSVCRAAVDAAAMPSAWHLRGAISADNALVMRRPGGRGYTWDRDRDTRFLAWLRVQKEPFHESVRLHLHYRSVWLLSEQPICAELERLKLRRVRIDFGGTTDYPSLTLLKGGLKGLRSVTILHFFWPASRDVSDMPILPFLRDQSPTLESLSLLFQLDPIDPWVLELIRRSTSLKKLNVPPRADLPLYLALRPTLVELTTTVFTGKSLRRMGRIRLREGYPLDKTFNELLAEGWILEDYMRFDLSMLSSWSFMDMEDLCEDMQAITGPVHARKLPVIEVDAYDYEIAAMVCELDFPCTLIVNYGDIKFTGTLAQRMEQIEAYVSKHASRKRGREDSE
jgi:hypothetical protein